MSEEEDGLHFETDGAWEVKAAAENTAILGESMEIVIGASIEATLGVDVSFCLLESLEVVAALCQEFAIAKWDKDNIHTAVREMQNQIHGEETTVTLGGKVAAIEQNLKAVNVSAKAADTDTKLRAKETKAVANDIALCTTKNDVDAAKDEAIGARTTAIASETTAMGAKIDKIGQKTVCAAQQVALIGTVLKSAVEQTDAVAVQTKMVAEHVILSGLVTKI
jgi:hypothetical protein